MQSTLIRKLAVIAVLMTVSLGVATGILAMRNGELHRQLDGNGNSGTHGADNADKKTALLREALEQQEIAFSKLRDDYEQLKRITSDRATSSFETPPSVASQKAVTRGVDPVPWLARVQRDDPERYRQIVTAREERRRQSDDWYREQFDRLDQRAQTSPSQEEVDLTTQIADTLGKLSDLRQQWDAVRALPEDERGAAAQQLQADTRTLYQQLNDLTRQDRLQQFQTLFGTLGFDPKSAEEYAKSSLTIFDNTRYTPQRGGGPGWGMGPVGPPNTQNPSTQAGSSSSQNR
jgi:hypothetical protein